MRFLLSPKWVTAHILVLGLGITFLFLGFWQLDRWREVRLSNQVHAARLAAEVVALPDLLAAVDGDVESLEYRRTVVTGTFEPTEEVLLRSQVHDGRAGFDVITPLRLAGGGTVLVDRGWVPLEFDSVPVVGAPPATGSVEIEGLIRLPQQRTSTGHDDFAGGRATTISRIDIDGLSGQVEGELAPVWIQVTGSVGPTVLPIPAQPPDFTDQGPHRDYAVQWFSFALIAGVGYGLLLRRAIRRRSGRGRGEAIDDLNPG